ncbi:MAG: hypothetical protein ACXAC5_02005 [Promethearchaeota archaeon]|jgi:outer membrane lipopolysaccharide assembly protein LptE/RlpB
MAWYWPFTRKSKQAQPVTREQLVERRDRIYANIYSLEQREAVKFAEGKHTSCQTVRRRLAAEVNQIRKDLRRKNTTVGLLDKQIDILSTDIHNRSLIQQGQAAELPTADELTLHAVDAEQVMETVSADANLVRSFEDNQIESLITDEERAIMREFEGEEPEQEKEVTESHAQEFCKEIVELKGDSAKREKVKE